MIKATLNNNLSADAIREMALGFQKSRVLLTAYELGIFTALGNKNKTAANVARITRSEKHATERLMEALCAIGLLKKKQNRFRNTPSALRFLVEGKPEFIAGLKLTVNMWDTWGTLTRAVRRGKSVLASRLDKRGEKWLDAFIAAMHERAFKQAKAAVSLIGLSGVRSILDVGGGSGAYAMAFVRAKRGIRATVFDLPKVASLTRKYVAREGPLDKIQIRCGDYRHDGLGNGFDLVFLSSVIHINSIKENIGLLRKCVKALNPKGRIAIQDFIMEKNRTRPAQGALFALNMLVATESGDTYTEAEVRSWMREAGLSNITREDTPFGTALIIGRK